MPSSSSSARPAVPSAPPRAVRRARGFTAALALLVGMVVLVPAATGCGVRLETDPPAALVPDDVETARQRAVADAVAVAALAGLTATSDDATAALAARAGEVAAAHRDALGGVYDPGTDPSPTPTPPPGTPSPVAAPATVADLVMLLAESADRARQDANALEDGRLARVLASVATSRELLARDLADATGTGVPVADQPPADVGEALPAGLAERDVLVVVRAEDAAGYAWEVVAARTSGDDRVRASGRAREHRDRAAAWARAAGASGTGLDPRRPVYELPDPALGTDPDATTAALAAQERALAATWATLVARAEAGSRAPLLAALTRTATVAADLDGSVAAFPGLPERA